MKIYGKVQGVFFRYELKKLADEEMGVKGGFIYEEVPHVTLKSIAQNEPSEKEILFDKPEIDRKRTGDSRISGTKRLGDK